MARPRKTSVHRFTSSLHRLWRPKEQHGTAVESWSTTRKGRNWLHLFEVPYEYIDRERSAEVFCGDEGMLVTRSPKYAQKAIGMAYCGLDL